MRSRLQSLRRQSSILALVAFAAFSGWISLASGLTSAAETPRPLVHSLFCDHMVLQRDKPVPVWGWAPPGSEVVVAINGQTQSTVASQNGSWRVDIGPFPAGGPHVLEISGEKSQTIQDVLVGDVWLCSGQSNMEMPVRKTNNAESEIANGNHPNIRLFTVARKIAKAPEEDIVGSWKVCSPESVGAFSAAGYYFGRDIQQKLNIPVGLIHSSWGGTPAEAWTSAAALSAMDDFRQATINLHQPDEVAEQAYEEKVAKWWTKGESPRLQGNWRKNDFDDTHWKVMEVPQLWEKAVKDLEAFDGIVRFRRSFELPAGLLDTFSDSTQQSDVLLSLGRINDLDTTWVNGHRVGGESQWDTPRRYYLPVKLLKSGTNVISVRVCDVQGSGGMYGDDENFRLVIRENAPGGRDISLAGQWKYEVGLPAAELPTVPPAFRSHNTVTVLYNGMIAPLTQFSIRGALWYQGESNAGRAEQYGRLLPTLIADWRKQFGHEFPFFIVQLANFRALQQEPVEHGWAEIRESQQKTADNDPNAGLVVITDIGEADDVHPTNKQDVGKRLALSALAITYGQDIVHSSPIYRGFVIDGQAIRLNFEGVGSGLVAHGEKLTGFAIAGAEGEFVWADAIVDGDQVVVSAPGISDPRRVRYNWASNPIGNLFNQEGLPAACFRTDAPE